MPLPTLTMTKSEFRNNARKIIIVAQTIASFTPTLKDDETVSFFDAIINSDEQFNKLCELFNITD